MVLATTYFTKNKTLNITKNDLIEIYIHYLERLEINNISYTNDTIEYKDNSLITPLNRYAPLLSRFQKVQIIFVDNEKQYDVYFLADFKRLYLSTGTIAIFSTSLLFLLNGPWQFSIGFGLFLFLWLTFGNYLLLKNRLPKYFTKLRDDIIQELCERT